MRNGSASDMLLRVQDNTIYVAETYVYRPEQRQDLFGKWDFEEFLAGRIPYN
jgi:hypothetical protein